MSIDYNEQAFCPTHVFLAMIGSLGIVPPDGSHDQIREWLERGVEDSMLLELVASLRDPKNTRWNELWKKTVTIDIQRRPITIHGHKGTKVSWKGVLRITGAGHTFESPFEGSFLTGAASEVQEKVDQVIQNLRDGIPYSKQTDITQKKELRAAVAKSLGLKGKQHRLLRTVDQVEVRDNLISMGLLTPDALAA